MTRRYRTGRPGIIAAATAIVVGLAATACGANSSAAPNAPVLRVVTGLYPLAQAVEQIGQNKVAVTDVVPAGSDPMTYRLSPAQAAEVHRATVVVQIGDDFQPTFEAAAAGARSVVDLRSQLAVSDPFVWLDPAVMARAVGVIASALERADPQAASSFRDGARAFTAEINSTGIDYESTLSTCPRHTIVTPDAAFLNVAGDYGLSDDVVGTSPDPDPATVAAAASRITTQGLSTAFSEPFVGEGTIRSVAAAAHLKVRTLDTLSGPPPGGWPRAANYINLLEANLGALNNALGCPNDDTGT
jgi:zinc transport system substrate-binding protein